MMTKEEIIKKAQEARKNKKKIEKRDTPTGYDFRIDPPFRPLKSIRNHCKFCMGGSGSEIKDCPIFDCFLYPYRLGKRPKNVKDIEEEENTIED